MNTYTYSIYLFTHITHNNPHLHGTYLPCLQGRVKQAEVTRPSWPKAELTMIQNTVITVCTIIYLKKFVNVTGSICCLTDWQIY